MKDNLSLFRGLTLYELPLPPSPHRLEYLQLPVKILPSPHSTLSGACVSALAHLPEILLEEEQESYATCQRSHRHYVIIMSQILRRYYIIFFSDIARMIF